MKLNETQNLAVNLIDQNINLIAGAGTGKTRVLTSRFVKIITETKNIDKILAITFTKKAASEMKARISSDLVKKGIAFNEDNLNVKTIHSFCQELITENAFLLNINPRFEIIEEENADTLLTKSINYVLKNNTSDDFKTYLTDFKTSIFQEVDQFKRLYYEFKNKDLNYKDIFLKSITVKENKYSDKDLKDKVLELSRSLNNNSKLKKFVKSNEFERILNSRKLNIDDLKIIEENLGTSAKFSEEINLIKEIISDLSLTFETSNHVYYKTIINILEEIDNTYTKLKENENFLDYDDIMIFAYKLLKMDSFRKIIRNKYDYILVDEYQDTNPIQNEIISSFKNANLFIVGDPKQSIYGFRGSDINSYFEFAREVEMSGKRLDMNINYRSDLGILEKINEIFGNVIDNYDALSSSIDQSGSISIYNSDDDEDIICLIKDLMKVHNLNDIAILTRINKEVNEIAKILKRENIKYNSGSKRTEDIEVLSLVSRIIELIESPKDNIIFLSLLNEPILKLYFEDLTEALLEGVVSLEDIKDIKSNERISNFIDFINYLIDIKNIVHLDEIISFIIDKLNDLKTLTSIEYEYLFEFQSIAQDFVKKYGDDIRLFNSFIKLKEFDDLEDGINVLTIHKSKGLEFDAVVIANMDKSNSVNIKDKILVDCRVGLGIKSDYSTANFDRIKENLKLKSEDEENRILYVAMTRAKKELVLFGNYDKFRPNSYFSIIKSSSCELPNYLNKDNADKLEIKKELKLLDFKKEKIYRTREYYTVSDFLNYRRSPKEFYKKYFLGIDEYTNGNNKEKVMDPKLLGTIVHYFAENNSKNNTEKSDIDIFIKRIFNSLDEELSKEKFNLIKKLCLNYLLMEEGNILHKELLFYYNLNGYLVKGYIDAVAEIEGKYYAIDYKISDAKKETLLETYKPQVLIYSKIFENLYNIKIDGAYIYGLKGRSKIKVNIVNSEVENVMEEFSNFIEFLRKHLVYKDYL